VRTAFAAIFFLKLQPALCFAETVIEGVHDYNADLHIQSGDVVRVMPGAVLTFAPGTGVKVEGVLDVRGEKENPVTFGPADGSWTGIAAASGGSVRLYNARISGADEAVKMSGGTLTVDGLDINGGTDGVVLEAMSDSTIKGAGFTGVAKTALTLRQGARASVSGSRIEGPGKTGIKTVGACPLDVKDTVIKGLDTGIMSAYPDSRPNMDGCTITGCGYGVTSEYPHSGAVLTDCEVTDNEYGVYAKKMSSPELNSSRVTGNKYGLYATEGSTPKAHGTLFSENDYGVYVTYSSYPVVNGCEFADNAKYAAYLDVQSYDWITKTGDGKRRERMGMRAAVSSGKKSGDPVARGTSAERGTNPKGAYVDFRSNYWGDSATREMSASADLADTSAIFDYFDRGTEVTDGITWTRDKADYTGYLKASPLKR